ncbi:MAG: trigger factor family protein [Actinomycetota bacterium]
MQCTVEQLEGNKVKVEVSVDEAAFEHDIDVAYRKLARQVRIPGFRPGKAPRRVIDAHLGADGKRAARTQAIEDAVPKYLAEAVKQHDIDVIATPKVEHVMAAGGFWGLAIATVLMAIMYLCRLYGNEYAEVVATIPSHYGASPDGTTGSIWC